MIIEREQPAADLPVGLFVTTDRPLETRDDLIDVLREYVEHTMVKLDSDSVDDVISDTREDGEIQFVDTRSVVERVGESVELVADGVIRYTAGDGRTCVSGFEICRQYKNIWVIGTEPASFIDV